MVMVVIIHLLTFFKHYGIIYYLNLLKKLFYAKVKFKSNRRADNN